MLLLTKPVTVSEQAVGVDQQEEPADVTSCSLEHLFVQHFLLKPASQHRPSCSQQLRLIPHTVHKPTGEEEEEGVNMAERLLGLTASLLTEKQNCPSPARCHTTPQRAAIKKLQINT